MPSGPATRLELMMSRLRSLLLIDPGLMRHSDATVLISGVGRSGSTWVSELLNYDNRYRSIFEPFDSERVRAAKEFRWYQYVRPGAENVKLASAARLILRGRFRSYWTDRFNQRILVGRRIIKDIRTNLMLRWLADLEPRMRIILVVRNPYSVVASWQRLDWEFYREWAAVSQQPELLEDYPVVKKSLQKVDSQSRLEVILLFWCVAYLVPLTAFRKGLYVLFYENLLSDPQGELPRLFEWVGRPLEMQRVMEVFSRASKTDMRVAPTTDARDRLASGAIRELPSSFCERVGAALEEFGLFDLYAPDGVPRRESGPIESVLNGCSQLTAGVMGVERRVGR